MRPISFKGEIEIINNLLKSASDYKNSEKYTEFIQFISKSRHYSFFNATLVYIQNPKVNFFATSSYWDKKFRRKVNPGAKPYIILVPRGPVSFVYDVLETSGEQLPINFMQNELKHEHSYTIGSLPDAIYDFAINEVKNWSIRIYYKVLPSLNYGSTKKKNDTLQIFLKENSSNKDNFATLIHELAHIFLGHLGRVELRNDKSNKVLYINNKSKIKRNTAELEAETISYLVCNKLKLDAKSPRYIALYITKDETFNDIDYTNIIKCADKISKLFLPKYLPKY